MKKTAAILLFAFLSPVLWAQGYFRTIVPTGPIAAGEPFRVQYVIQDGASVTNFSTPDFRNFKIVGGPDIYVGENNRQSGFRQSKNYIFTLIATKPGRYYVPGAMITRGGKRIKSDDVEVEVLTHDIVAQRTTKEGISSDYLLKQGEDVQDKIRQNLFIKVSVDKKTCYVGEPVLATFKLYSRLESKSDITKNPGFYGFTVYDMVNLQDNLVESENIGGKIFDVHTIRKVQLYPLQAGMFVIDAMNVKNRVEFSRSAVNKKTEQEIAEGMLGGGSDDPPAAGTEVFETEISTEPVTINVKPVTEKNRPALFNGATGKFTVTATVLNDHLAKNEEGVLELAISGQGNFTQLNAPAIQWPAGIEGFDPTIKDTFDKAQIPLAGSRAFRYAFVSSGAGSYIIPAVSFSFFNPDSGTFKTVTTAPVQVNIGSKEKDNDVIPGAEKTSDNSFLGRYWLILGIVFFAALGGVIWFLKNRKPKQEWKEQPPAEQRPVIDIDTILLPAILQSEVGDKEFYTALHGAIWKFFALLYNLAGSKMTKQNLARLLSANNADEKDSKEVETILQQCEAGMFTDANLEQDKGQLLETIRRIMSKLKE